MRVLTVSRIILANANLAVAILLANGNVAAAATTAVTAAPARVTAPAATAVVPPVQVSPVQRMISQGILSPQATNALALEQPLTRGEFAQAVQTMFDLPAAEAPKTRFVDLAESHPAYSAIYAVMPFWNRQALCVGCVLPTAFFPDAAVTRAEMAVVLVNVLASKGELKQIETASLRPTLESISDANKVPPGGQQHVAIAVENGLLELDAQHRFQPKASITRADSATILDRTQTRFAIPLRTPLLRGPLPPALLPPTPAAPAPR
jgi:hypothetical protein